MSLRKTLVISANDTSDFGTGPQFASVQSPDQLLSRLRYLQQVVNNHELSELRVYHSADWGGIDVEGGLKLTCGELVVDKTSFRFVDTPSDSNIIIETKPVDIDALEKALDGGGETIFLGDDLEDLEEAFLDHVESKVNADNASAAVNAKEEGVL
jgi:hypothetical protein